MKNEKYIKVYFYSILSLIKDGIPYPIKADGLFRSIIYIRRSKTKVIEGFYGQIFLFEDKGKAESQQRAIDAMMRTLKKSDTFKDGNYEVRNHLTGEWEQVKLQ